MIVLNVRHLTSYSYKRPVGFGEHRILFRPRDSYDQRLLSAALEISPEPSSLRWIHDAFGNCVAIARFEGRKARHLRFESHIALEHAPEHAPHFVMDEKARTYPFQYEGEEATDLAASARRHYPDNGEVEAWARRFLDPSGRTPTHKLLGDMTHAIREEFAYSRRTNPGTQKPLETLATGTGTCRDFALLFMEAARSLGLAARFVTGYIYVPSRDGATNLGGGATHAWAQIFLPGAGWVEFDPTNAIIGSRDLIRVGVAREPRQALPLWGSYIGKKDDPNGMTVQVNVTSAEPEGDGEPAEPALERI